MGARAALRQVSTAFAAWWRRPWRASLGAMQLQEVVQPFPAAALQDVVVSGLLLKRIADGEHIDFLGNPDESQGAQGIDAPQKTEGAPPAALAAGPPRLTDRQVWQSAVAVAKATAIAAIWLRRDLALASGNPSGDHSALLADMLRRLNALEVIAAIRPHALAREPRLAQWWTDDRHRLTLWTLSDSKRVVHQIVNRDLQPLSPFQVLIELVRVLPTHFSVAEQTPDDVIEFCEAEGATFALALLVAAKAVLANFPGARDVELDAVNDPEGAGGWVTIRVTVPGRDSFSRYEQCVNELVRRVPADELHKIRVDYIPE